MKLRLTWALATLLTLPLTANAEEPEKFRNHVLIGGGPLIGMVGENFQNGHLGLGMNLTALSETTEVRLIAGIALNTAGSVLRTPFDVDLITSMAPRDAQDTRKFAVGLRAVRLPNADFLDLIQFGMRFTTGPNSKLSIFAVPGGLAMINRNPGLAQYSPGARVHYLTTLKKLTENKDGSLGEVSETDSEQALILELEGQVRALLTTINPRRVTPSREPLGVALGGSVGLTYVFGNKFLRGTYDGNFIATQSTSPQMRLSETIETQSSHAVNIFVGRAL